MGLLFDGIGIQTAVVHNSGGFGHLGDAIHSGEHLYHRLLAYRAYIPLGVLLLTLAAAACYGASSVLQQREAHRAPARMTMSLGLIWHLLKRPMWLLGNLAGFVAFALQFLALRHGSLALVQPLLVTGLVFALAGSAALDHRRPSRSEFMWMVLTMAGLALFIAVAQPGPGLARGSNLGWALLGLATAAGVGVLVLMASAWRRWRALSLGIAAGLLGGLLSALIERTAHRFDHGFVHALVGWSPYALCVVALFGLILTQSAYQAGDIRLSLPALTVTEPITAILIGQILLGEHISLTVAAVFGEVVGLGLMALGVFGLGQAAGTALGGEPAPREATTVA